MSETIQIFRQSDNRIQTIGQGECGGFLFYTLELPWMNNAQYISCIPPGEYPLQRHVSPKFGDCYWVRNVPGRSEILIHVANYYTQILGCIIPGMNRADINNDGQMDVVSSGVACEKLLVFNANKLLIHGPTT